MKALDFNVAKMDYLISEIIMEFDKGRPVIIPTDTLYGLACPISNHYCLEKIFELKSRPYDMTLPVSVGDIKSITIVAVPDGRIMEYIEGKLPGPYTFLINARPDLPEMITREGKVAVRIPDHPLFRPLCEKAGPLALTSANIHGEDPVGSFEDAREQFGEKGLLMIIDEGNVSGLRSEIVDLTEVEPMLIRDRR